jgi:hypothetical protein
MSSLCFNGLNVFEGNIMVLNVAQNCFCCEFQSRDKIKRTEACV